MIHAGTCARTSASEDYIVLLKVQKVIDPVSPLPRTLDTASLDESQLTETLVRTSFWPTEQFRRTKELAIDSISEEDKLFNERLYKLQQRLVSRGAKVFIVDKRANLTSSGVQESTGSTPQTPGRRLRTSLGATRARMGATTSSRPSAPKSRTKPPIVWLTRLVISSLCRFRLVFR